jgi:hypothetical protein
MKIIYIFSLLLLTACAAPTTVQVNDDCIQYTINLNGYHVEEKVFTIKDVTVCKNEIVEIKHDSSTTKEKYVSTFLLSQNNTLIYELTYKLFDELVLAPTSIGNVQLPRYHVTRRRFDFNMNKTNSFAFMDHLEPNDIHFTMHFIK